MIYIYINFYIYMYIISSEYIYFYISVKITSYTFLLVFKIVSKSLQCILNELSNKEVLHQLNSVN